MRQYTKKLAPRRLGLCWLYPGRRQPALAWPIPGMRPDLGYGSYQHDHLGERSGHKCGAHFPR